jgi:hypothetical protein
MKRIIFVSTFILSLIFCGFSQNRTQITINDGVATCDIIPFYETPYTRVTSDPVIQILYNRDSIVDMKDKVLRGITFYTTTQSAKAVIDVVVKETGRNKAGSAISGGITVFRGMVNIKNHRIDIPFNKIYRYKGKTLVIKIIITQSDRISCKGTTITTPKQTLIISPGLWDHVTFSPKTTFVYY